MVEHDDAAAELDDAVGCRRDVLLVRADNDDVVAVVRDGGRHRAGLEAVALDVADADVVRVLMALDDRDLEDVVFQVDPVGVAGVGRHDLARDHAEHGARAGLGEIVGGEVRDVEGLVGALDEMRIDLGSLKGRDLFAVEHELALLVDLKNIEVAEVVDDNEVGEEAGRDGAAVVEQEVAGSMMARALDGDDGVHTRGDGLLDDVVDVALFQQIVGVLVVRAEHTVGVILRREQRQQRVKVARRGALADHDVLAALELGERIAHVGALVVGVDAGGNVGVEVVAGKAGSVAVDLLVMRLRRNDLLEHLLVGVGNADVVHHLGKALDAVVLVEAVDGAVVKVRAALVERGGGHAARQHEAHVERQVFGRLKHILDAVGAHDVGDLVRVGDNGRGAVRKNGLGKLLRADERAFQMDVRVHKAGQHKLAAHVDLDLALVMLAHAGDQAGGHGDIAAAELVAEHIHIGRVLEHEVGLFASRRHLHHMELFVELAVDPARVAFLVCHRHVPPVLALS